MNDNHKKSISPFSFNGRITRQEYLISMILDVIPFYAVISLSEKYPIAVLLLIPILWVAYAQGAKRCHDLGNSGWFQLLPFYALWMIFQDSMNGPNKHGENPKGVNDPDMEYKASNSLKSIATVVGYIFGSFFILGILFKIQHWAGAGVILIVSLTILACVFVPIVFIQRINEDNRTLSVVTNSFALASISSLFLGILFKVQHWQGAGIMLTFGALFLCVPTLLLYVIHEMKDNNKRFGEYWKIVFGIIFFGVFFIFYGLNYSRDFINFVTVIDSQIVKANNNFTSANLKILNYIELVNEKQELNYFEIANQIHQENTEILNYIESIKVRLINEAEGPNSIGLVNHGSIYKKDEFDTPTRLIGMPESELGIELVNKIKVRNEEIKINLNQLSLNDTIINKCLIEIFSNDYNHINNSFLRNLPLHSKLFYHVPMIGALALLANLENSILSAEFEILMLIHDKQKRTMIK